KRDAVVNLAGPLIFNQGVRGSTPLGGSRGSLRMSTTFPPYVERQLKLLATRTTLYRSIDLGINKFAHPDGTGGRAHEVCMVFRRPGGDVLTFRKTFYPPAL